MFNLMVTHIKVVTIGCAGPLSGSVSSPYTQISINIPIQHALDEDPRTEFKKHICKCTAYKYKIKLLLNPIVNMQSREAYECIKMSNSFRCEDRDSILASHKDQLARLSPKIAYFFRPKS